MVDANGTPVEPALTGVAGAPTEAVENAPADGPGASGDGAAGDGASDNAKPRRRRRGGARRRRPTDATGSVESGGSSAEPTSDAAAS
jgi:hypothetical protein